MHRRDLLLNTAKAAGAASLLGADSVVSAENSNRPTEIIDTNVSLFQWPFRRLPLDDTSLLVDQLRSLGITQAWAGSFEALLHRDLTSVNTRVAEACAVHHELQPIGSINIQLPGWQDDLKQCVERHHMHGIRVYPNYHGYRLADRGFRQLLAQASESGLIVQIAAAMEDQRTHSSLVSVPEVDLEMLPNVLSEAPDAKVQILNQRVRSDMLRRFSTLNGVFFDMARADGTDTIATLMRNVPDARLCFGSHAPFLIPDAALIRVAESNLTEPELKPLLSENAKKLVSS